MNLNVLVTGGLYDSQSGYSAQQFCIAALAAGHSIDQVFFYQNAVVQATRLAEPLADEFDATEGWVKLSEESGIPLIVCVSSAERRGIVAQDQRDELGKSASSLHPHFDIAGLGALHDAGFNSDRTVTFK